MVLSLCNNTCDRMNQIGDTRREKQATVTKGNENIWKVAQDGAEGRREKGGRVGNRPMRLRRFAHIPLAIHIRSQRARQRECALARSLCPSRVTRGRCVRKLWQ